MFGELIPLGGGDPIPLLKKTLLVGRRESCDIVLRFANVSAHHCQLTLESGYWYVKDLGSRNGIKVNDVRVAEKPLVPGDELAIAKHKYTVQYSPFELGAVGPPPVGNAMNSVFSSSLLERAGLDGKKGRQPGPPSNQTGGKRFDVLNNEPGQIRNPNNPL